jgi:hypothetical protein
MACESAESAIAAAAEGGVGIEGQKRAICEAPFVWWLNGGCYCTVLPPAGSYVFETQRAKAIIYRKIQGHGGCVPEKSTVWVAYGRRKP